MGLGPQPPEATAPQATGAQDWMGVAHLPETLLQSQGQGQEDQGRPASTQPHGSAEGIEHSEADATFSACGTASHMQDRGIIIDTEPIEPCASAGWLQLPWCHHHVDQLWLQFEASYWNIATFVASQA